MYDQSSRRYIGQERFRLDESQKSDHYTAAGKVRLSWTGGGEGKEALRSDAVAALWKLCLGVGVPSPLKSFVFKLTKSHSLQHR